MRYRSRDIVVMAAVLASLVNGIAVAQDKPTDTMDLLREKVRADKKLVVAVALDLTEREAKEFWPVYGAYQSDMIEYYDRVAKLLSDYAAVYPNMNDETATRLLGQFTTLETDYAALLTRYQPRFQRVLPPRKVVRLYQLENKLRAVLNYQLARDIPLAKLEEAR
jgi:hypothetical protein